MGNEMLSKIDTKKKASCMMAHETSQELTRDNFKLAFLRCEVFEVKPAVDRWIKYWNVRLSILGEEKAFLPLTLEGAMKGNEKAVSSPYFTMAEGTTDPDGRAIFLQDFREEKGDLSDDELLVAVFYHCHIFLSNELAQKKGTVIYMRCLESFFDGRQSLWKKFSRFDGAFPARVSALHIVDPPRFIKVLVTVMKMVLGKKLRSRLKVHSGSIDQTLKSLSKFGLGSKDTLPEMFGGNLSFSPGAKLTFLC